MSCLLALPAAASAKAAAPARFQGLVEMKLELESGSGVMRLLVSGTEPAKAKLEMDVVVSGLSEPLRLAVIQDDARPGTLVLADYRRKVFSEIAVGDAARLAEAEPDKGKYKVKALGRGTVLGYECAHLALTRGDELVDAWVTRDLMDVYGVLRKLQEANTQVGEAAVFKALEEAGHPGLPMRYTVIREGQKVSTEVGKVERRAVPDSEFALPGDYVRVDGAGSADGKAGAAGQARPPGGGTREP